MTLVTLLQKEQPHDLITNTFRLSRQHRRLVGSTPHRKTSHQILSIIMTKHRNTPPDHLWLSNESAEAKPHRRSRNRWQPESVCIQSIFDKSQPCESDHPYLLRHGIAEAAGHFFDGTDVVGIPCPGAFIFPIHSKDRKLVNALLKVQAADGAFEDLCVPGAPIAGCWSRIGKGTDVKVVTVDLACGLVIFQATGLGVAVAHYDGNLMQVCKAIRAAHPDDQIVIAVSAQNSDDMPLVKKIVVAAALAVDAAIALPGGEISFVRLNQSKGAEEVARRIKDARHLSSEHTAEYVFEGKSATLQWTNRVHASGLLAAMCAYLSRYTVLPFSPIYAMVLWILATHLTSIFNIAPVLALLSMTRRCGKSVTLLALAALTYKPKMTSETTAAGLYEMCNDGFTPIMDEGDQFLQKRANPTNAIVNSGYTRIASKVTRKGKEYETFCFKFIAAIGTLPTTIMDRSIVVPLIRKGAQEKVERYKAKENDDASVLRAMIERFATDRSDQIQNAEPGELAMSNDRAADNWEPLFAIAHCAGPQWLKNAHQAAIDLTPGDDEISLILEEFICDMVSIFVRTSADFISTFDLIEALCKDENKPWATYSRSQQKMSIHDLGKLMREAKVKVGEQKHDANGNRRGYYRRDVEHLFDGYGPNATSA